MPSVETAKVQLPLPASCNAQQAVTTCTAQSATLKQCPAYATTPAVQSAVADMDTAVAALDVTVGKVANVEAELATLKKTRAVQLGTVRLKHDAVATAVSSASNNDPQAAQAWVGKTRTRAKPAPVTQDVTPPTGAGLKTIKSRPGTVVAFCTPEQSAAGYAFQTGSDANHPETWPPASFSNGHTFTLRNQPIGSTVNVRIAIVRRGSVQSGWTQVLSIVVR